MAKLGFVLGLIGCSFFGGAVAHAKCVVIQGGIYLRAEPTGEDRDIPGKVIQTLKEGTTLWEGSVIEDWIEVYAERNPRGEIRCSNPEIDSKSTVRGWVRRSELKDLSFEEALKVDRLGFLLGARDGGDFRSPVRAVAKEAMDCGYYEQAIRGEVSRGFSRPFRAGQEVGSVCTVKGPVVTCLYRGFPNDEYTVCLKESVTTSDAEDYDDEERMKKLESAAKRARETIEKLAGSAFVAPLTQLHPEWLPLLIPHPRRDHRHAYDLELAPSFLDAAFSIQKLSPKKRKALLFFKDAKAALKQSPSIAFEGTATTGVAIEVRDLPISLKSSEETADDDHPRVCLASADRFAALNVCQFRDGTEIYRTTLDFRAVPVSTIDEDLMKKAVDRLDRARTCCEWNHKKYLQFAPARK